MHKTIINGLILLMILGSCKQKTKEIIEVENTDKEPVTEVSKTIAKPFFKLSLAQWSLHKAMQSGEIDPKDFAQKASELGFEGVEYVSQLYAEDLKKDADPKKAMQQLLEVLLAKSKQYKMQNLIIMVDGEGDLAVLDENERNEAVEKHKKWVDAAKFLGCHSIRVNLFGTNDPNKWVDVATDGLSKLSDYAASKDVNVIVENHGYLSSNASLLIEVMKKVNKPNCGTLPDFGNFCLKRKDGVRWGASCIEEYPKYKGVAEMMPYAKAVSAKSHDFDAQGNETKIDYKKMLDIVKKAGYKGFIGVEYEGEQLEEIKGIIATRDLLINAAKQLN
ncbi:sugar phosphate isomerase/epimerase [Aquimarina sp. AD10]|uniref:sugar phosphate isomerase/epimerase family protein n=1 Tax=Aquimarina sp. AD10 TaxID=1714849 RepID=UPI000E479D40|nr:sugar phosphate isomerase/epimerase family protein [Aquimarina sp. AD10]AXT58937.1 sugar phosphate isomerase/epimerase [Aquimarina sp. AD10]RKM99587.1 sugar phosphate isomerase/epimerase [Aquimarina sp. AD10]